MFVHHPLSFPRRLLEQPRWLVAWVGWLGIVNLASLLFLERPEGRWTALAFGAALVLMVVVYTIKGFNRLLGIAHLVTWGPLLVYLIPRLGALPSGSDVTTWAWLLVATNAVSLLVDAVDVVRYAAGDRQ